MIDTKCYDENDHADVRALLMGRRIVKAEMGERAIPGGTYSWESTAEGLLTLDDGTLLYVVGNDGGCSCSAGCYPLVHLADTPNIITRVEFDDEPAGDDSPGDGHYAIYVYAENRKINVARFEGSDGNGYYGTGYRIFVVPADREAS